MTAKSKKRRQSEKGIALILSIGIVALLAILGVTFAIDMRLEQKAAANLRDATRAKYLAQSGIDQAMTALKLYAAEQFYACQDDNWFWGYGAGWFRCASIAGNVITVEGNPEWTADQFANKRSIRVLNRLTNASNIYTITANNGSYPYTLTCAATADPNDSNPIDGTGGTGNPGIRSGDGFRIVKGILEGLGDYEVRVIDCASQIYLNSGDPIEAGSTYDDASNQLRRILNNLGTAVGASSATIGDTIVGARTSGGIYYGYQTKDQVRQSTSPADYNLIKDYITTVAYVDTNQSPDRAPVNVNTASKPVLIAVLLDLVSNITEAGNLADDIISRRFSNPFESWDEFNTYINTAPAGIDATEQTNIKNNANPNIAESSKPPATGPLPNRTTEFCFHTGGNYEIISTGRIYDSVANVVAEKKVRAIANIFNVWNQTTQAQFAANALYGLDTGTAGQVQIMQTVSAATRMYKQDFDTDENAWSTLGGASRSVPVGVEPPPQFNGVEAGLWLETSEGTYVDLPEQARVLYVSMLVYSADNAAAAYRVYISDGSGTNAGIGPSIERNIPIVTGDFEYERPLGIWTNFNSAPLSSFPAPDRIEIIADVTGADTVAGSDAYNVYFNGTVANLAGPNYGIPFLVNTGLSKLSRVVIENLSATELCYVDDYQAWCGGPLWSNSFTTMQPVQKWGTVAWTETTPLSDNEIKLQLSSNLDVTDTWKWKGPSGSSTDTDDTDFYSSADGSFGNLDEFGNTYFYVKSTGSKIADAHDPATPAVGSMKYLATLAVTGSGQTLPIFEDITITYLPYPRILYWRELGEGE